MTTPQVAWIALAAMVVTAVGTIAYGLATGLLPADAAAVFIMTQIVVVVVLWGERGVWHRPDEEGGATA